MTWPVAFAVVGGLFALSYTIIRIVVPIYGRGILKDCKEKFATIDDKITGVNDSGELRRAGCMDIFQQIKNNVQELMMQNATFKIEINNLSEKILEVKLKQDRIESKIDKLMFLLPKRIGNHVQE